MEFHCRLEEKDIAEIIAEHFHVPVKDVSLQTEERWEGYGPTEHQVNYVTCSVSKQIAENGKDVTT